MQRCVFVASALTLLTSATAFPNVIEKSSSTFCQAATVDGSGAVTVVTDTGESSCDLFGLQFLSASVDYVRTAPGIVAGYASAAWAPYPDALASALLDVTEEFITPGPPRDGIAYLWLRTSRYGFADGSGSSSVSVKDFSYGTQTFAGGCYEHLCYSWDPFAPPGTPLPIPFRLGVPFQIQVQAAVEISSGRGEAGRSYDAAVEVQLFEADGITPVAIGEIPEPRMTFLTSAGLLTMLLQCKRLRR